MVNKQRNRGKKQFKITSFQIGILLLSIAVIVTAVTVLNIVKSNSWNLLTGAATTGTGQTNLSITSTTSMSFPVTTINFGSGYVGSSGTACVMASNGQHNQTGPYCNGFFNVTNGFYIENDGNQNLSVNYSCAGNCSAAAFIGGTSPAVQLRVYGAFFRNQSSQTNDTAPSCQAYTTGGARVQGWNITTGGPIAAGTPEGRYYSLDSNQNATLCGNNTYFPLSGNFAIDAGVVDVNISIPEDAPTSSNNTFTLTFNAKSS